MRHFLSLADAGADAIQAMLAAALASKRARAALPKGAADPQAPLAGRVLAMVFEQSSTRTRVSFDIAMRQLGGGALVLDAGTTQLGRGETIADTARVLSRMADAIMLRTDGHAKLEELAQNSAVPVLNGLTAAAHPCQIMADLLTLSERGHTLGGLQVAWLGDGNNVLNSWVEAAGLLGIHLRIAGPQGYEPDPQCLAAARHRGARITLGHDASAAVDGADAVVTDCWVSMGQPHAQAKLAAMAPFQVTEALMARAAPHAVFLHCLPAHRGEEVAARVIDGPQSAVWDEAENRIHAQKAILRWVFGTL